MTDDAAIYQKKYRFLLVSALSAFFCSVRSWMAMIDALFPL